MISDATYLAAVRSGDLAAAQRMVDAAAKTAGYTIGPVFHGRSTEFHTFKMPEKGERALFFSDSPEEANRFPILRGSRPLEPVSAYLTGKLKRVQYPKDSEGSFLYDSDVMGKLLETARSKGFDGVEIDGIQNFEGGPLSKTYAVFKPSQAKIADAVTENNLGNIIPLSKRFDSTSNDIRNPNPMKTNHTADEVVTIEGPQDHSLDIERVRTVIDDEMHRVGVVYVTLHFIANRRPRSYSAEFDPGDNWFSVLEKIFDDIPNLYKVSIEPSGSSRKALDNPREHRVPKRQEKFLSGIARRNPTLESGAQFDDSDAAQVALEARTLSQL